MLTIGTEVVPSCGKEQREDDVDLYKAHHAIENFFEPVQSLPVRGERADQDGAERCKPQMGLVARQGFATLQAARVRAFRSHG